MSSKKLDTGIPVLFYLSKIYVRQIHQGRMLRKMMAVEVNFEQGAIGPMHNHPYEQLTYVLSGEFEFTIGEEKQIVTAGDTLYKAPHVMHGCICLKPGTLLDTFTPVRDDFLK
ncbi:TPA: cupin domain-containing protein [Yersinia enterocolitica]